MQINIIGTLMPK